MWSSMSSPMRLLMAPRAAARRCRTSAQWASSSRAWSTDSSWPTIFLVRVTRSRRSRRRCDIGLTTLWGYGIKNEGRKPSGTAPENTRYSKWNCTHKSPTRGDPGTGLPATIRRNKKRGSDRLPREPAGAAAVPIRTGKKKRDVTSLSYQGEGESGMLAVLPVDLCDAQGCRRVSAVTDREIEGRGGGSSMERTAIEKGLASRPESSDYTMGKLKQGRVVRGRWPVGWLG